MSMLFATRKNNYQRMQSFPFSKTIEFRSFRRTRYFCHNDENSFPLFLAYGKDDEI